MVLMLTFILCNEKIKFLYPALIMTFKQKKNEIIWNGSTMVVKKSVFNLKNFVSTINKYRVWSTITVN